MAKLKWKAKVKGTNRWHFFKTKKSARSLKMSSKGKKVFIRKRF